MTKPLNMSSNRLPTPTRASRRPWLLAAGLVMLVMVIYANSMRGLFVFDDDGSIKENDSIKSLWPITQVLSPPGGRGLTVEGRPILNLSLAVNWAISGEDTGSYHAVNVLIHLLAVLTLYGLTQRTLLLPKWKGRFDRQGDYLAFAVAGIWAAHPLQTESVTYIVQRAESLMGMFYLATLYFSLRAFTDSKSRVCHGVGCTPSPAPASVCREEACTPYGWVWTAAAIAACAMGMGSKEVTVSAPLAVVLYDRVFLFDRFKDALRRRWRLYLGLALSMLVLFYELTQSGNRGGTAGFTAKMSSWAYAQTQSVWIIRYLGLAIWPSRLVLDYGVDVITGWGIWPYACGVVGLLVASIWAIRRMPWAGYLALLFWMALAPTSSIVPVVTQTAAEHRMYLPLAPVVALLVLGGVLLYDRFALRLNVGLLRRRTIWRYVAPALLVAILAALSARTIVRNADYCDRARLLEKSLRDWPANPRVRQDYANYYADRKEFAKALALNDEVVRRKPDWYKGYFGRAMCLKSMGRDEEALRDYSRAIELNPNAAQCYCNRATIRFTKGQYDQALEDLDTAIEIRPRYTLALYNRGGVHLVRGEYAAAKDDFDRVLKLEPSNVEALAYRAGILRQQRNLAAAMEDANRALQLDPRSGLAYERRAAILADLGRITEARADALAAQKVGQTLPNELIRKLQ